jgi:hypothetical protein
VKRIVHLGRVRRARDALRALAAEHPELTTDAARQRLADHLNGEDPMGKTDGKMERALYIRCHDDDIDRLDALHERFPIMSKNQLARAALRIGLAEIEERGGAALEAHPAPKRGRKPAR